MEQQDQWQRKCSTSQAEPAAGLLKNKPSPFFPLWAIHFSLVSALRETGSPDAAWKECQEVAKRTRPTVTKLTLPGISCRAQWGLADPTLGQWMVKATSVTLPTALLWDHRGDTWPSAASFWDPQRNPMNQQGHLLLYTLLCGVYQETYWHPHRHRIPFITAGPTWCLLPYATADRGGYPPAARFSKKSS